MHTITSQDDLDTVLGAEEAVLLKHGAHCPISAHARDEMAAFATSHPDVTCASLEVTNYRSLAKAVVERLGVVHQSPQLLVLRGGAVVWTAEHYAITARDVEARVSGAKTLRERERQP